MQDFALKCVVMQYNALQCNFYALQCNLTYYTAIQFVEQSSELYRMLDARQGKESLNLFNLFKIICLDKISLILTHIRVLDIFRARLNILLNKAGIHVCTSHRCVYSRPLHHYYCYKYISI